VNVSDALIPAPELPVGRCSKYEAITANPSYPSALLGDRVQCRSLNMAGEHSKFSRQPIVLDRHRGPALNTHHVPGRCSARLRADPDPAAFHHRPAERETPTQPRLRNSSSELLTPSLRSCATIDVDGDGSVGTAACRHEILLMP
jgi:hypothetical protein